MPNNEKKKLTPGYWIALGIVALAVILGVVGFVLMQTQRHEPDHETSPPTSAEPTTAPEEPKLESGACDVPGGNITTVPADLRWAASAGVTWPISDSLGPVSVKDGFAVCFSRSPVGAALAAVTSQFGAVDHGTVPTMEFYVVDSPGKAIALEKSASLKSLPDQLQQYGMQLVGYRVDEYTESRALVRLVYSVPNSGTGFRALPFPMEWVQGDWRVKLQDTGVTGQAIDVNAGQFTRWSSNG
ncbi:MULTISPECIES: hypothetical protein [Bacteria]|uniref:hypothetical protein n=1 Tax=Bacteria TaxID=2 RepID=UPI003C7CFDC6